MKKDKIFQVLQQHFTTQGEGDNEKIEGKHFFNRACFWMATAISMAVSGMFYWMKHTGEAKNH